MILTLYLPSSRVISNRAPVSFSPRNPAVCISSKHTHTQKNSACSFNLTSETNADFSVASLQSRTKASVASSIDGVKALASCAANGNQELEVEMTAMAGTMISRSLLFHSTMTATKKRSVYRPLPRVTSTRWRIR